MLLQELKEQSYKLSASDRLELIGELVRSLQNSVGQNSVDEISVNIDPLSNQKQRPAFGVMKGSGEILGDIIAPVLPESLWEVLQ
jgi:hypothetical protein